MSKKDAGSPDGLLSPYMSLRAAVRPAALAHALLTREQARGSALVKEAEDLLKTTRELLQTAGLVRILSAEREPEIADTNTSDDRRAEVLNAYAEAGILWAKILGSSLELAEIVARTGRFDDAKRWVGVLSSVGEEGLAKDLADRLESNFLTYFLADIPRIHSEMNELEIEESIELLRRLLREAPKAVHHEAVREVGAYLIPLARSIARYGGSDIPYDVEYIAEGRGAGNPSCYQRYFDEISSGYDVVKFRRHGS